MVVKKNGNGHQDDQLGQGGQQLHEGEHPDQADSADGLGIEGHKGIKNDEHRPQGKIKLQMRFRKDCIRNKAGSHEKQAAGDYGYPGHAILSFAINFERRSGRVLGQMLRDQAQNGGIGAQDRKDVGQHQKGVEYGHDAQHLCPIASCDDDADDHAQGGSDDLCAQGPDGTGKDFGKPGIGY